MGQTHEVSQGECLSGIAKKYGFGDWHKIYDHPDNSDFKNEHPNPNIIFPGDKICIPDRETREESGGTEKRHSFKCKRPTRVLRIVAEDINGKRLINAEWTLTMASGVFKGTTNGDGLLEQKIPIDEEDAKLKIAEYHWDLKVGHLNPLGEDTPDKGVSGAQGRLWNMGYDVGPIDGILGRKTQSALKQFQAEQKLTVNGALDATTRKKLKEVHGC